MIQYRVKKKGVISLGGAKIKVTPREVWYPKTYGKELYTMEHGNITITVNKETFEQYFREEQNANNRYL